MLADLESLEKRASANLEKRLRGGDKEAKEQFDLVRRALGLLQDGKPARLVERKPEEEKAFRMLGLLSSKPVLYVCNVEEASADQGNEFSARVIKRAEEEGAVAVVVSAKIESEIAVLPLAEQKDYLDTDRSRRAGPEPRDPGRLRAPSSGDLFHRGAEGGARLDDHQRHQSAAGGRRDPHRFRKGFHPLRDHRL